MRSIKSLLGIISVRRPHTFILSILIHMLIFSIPVSMVIKPQINDMELFVSIEDMRIQNKSVEPQMETKKSQPKPVKQIDKPIEAPRLKIKKSETTEPTREVRAEPVKEVKVEPIEFESNTQPTIENKEAFFTPTFRGGTEGNTDGPAEERPIGMASGVGKQPSGSLNATGGGAESLMETRFGASVAPAFLHKEMPVYPMMARKFGKEGKVVLKLTIDENGNLLDVEVMDKAGYGFTEAAVEAVKKSTFLPAKKDGKPIASRALLPIRFQLERD
jgi:protein TonB